jgi:2-keto-myo-inositol isomerase
VLPIEPIVRALRDRGYDGVASVEIFRPEYWRQNPRQVARTAHARASAVLTAAGYDQPAGVADASAPHASGG